ncbi:hypothetical protein Patl1_32735 [Pistacia atlantica]|uniref:Uncharacterized protein n=1 Tax=Pistacia atlantica TaxID=434234 RepID=A0ACC1AQ35_9ROSI|nr:hypothetical protein Patl1_32735 [Pistacia atlantica]
MATVRMIDIAVNFTDGMFKGMYHGKQCHVSDIAAVLNRAWSAGVDRIINIVSNVNLDCRLDLKLIALQARNSEYNPKRFSAVIMRIREPKTTELILASGKMVITGAKSLACSHGAFSSYEPELFPGAKVRDETCTGFENIYPVLTERWIQVLVGDAWLRELAFRLVVMSLESPIMFLVRFTLNVVVTGGSLEESKEALAIAETDGRLFCTVGVHPTRCKEFEESGDPEKHFQALLSLAKQGIEKGKVVAIGECGLDYDRLHFCPAEIQRKYFEKQFELAYATKLPMFLHMRAAAEDFCEILERNKDRFSGGVTHSFTDSEEDCDKLLSFSNMYIGVNGCSLKATENLDVVRGVPVERMMIETDSPYCEIKNTHAGMTYVKSTWPSKKKEKYDPECIVKGRNEPCLVQQVLEVVAGCKGIDNIDQLSRTLYYNTCRVFFPHDLDSAADALLAGSHDAQ